MTKLSLHHRPFDAHVHARDPGGAMFNAVVPHTARQCFGALFMPNTKQFLTTAQLASAYCRAVYLVAGVDFIALIAGYLADDMRPAEIESGYRRGAWHAMKFYPRGATTNSHGGLPTPLSAGRQLETMERIGMPLLLHPEVNVWRGEETDPYDRETIFFCEVLPVLRATFPGLRISLEHITTRTAVEYLRENGASDTLVATVTAHHLLTDRIDYFRGGPNPHLHCWPVLKRREDRDALLSLIAEGHDWLFAGSDSAPHPTTAKERACGCAGGVFTAHAMVELYAEAFEQRAGALNHLEAFLCLNGPTFYGIDAKPGLMVLEDVPRAACEMIETSDGQKIRPFGYHEAEQERWPFRWHIAEGTCQE